ncbi:MAG: metallophosphoesterase, partial [Planctomycetota bacterium]
MLPVSIPRTSSSRGRGSAVLILLLSLLLGGRAFGQDPVVILHWNDFHGQVYPMRFSSGEVGGIRAISAVVRAEAATVGEENLLVLDAGDWYQGTPEGMLPEGRMIIDLFNALGVDATTIGNHDFDLGVDTLRSLIEAAEFPVLGGNILLPDRSRPVDYALPQVLIERGGIRFG